MRERNIRLGPGAASLILIVVVLCMSVLGMLTLMSARSDDTLSRRAAEVVTQTTQLNTQAERRMAELDAILVKCAGSAQDDDSYMKAVEESLPEGLKLSGRSVLWQEGEGTERALICRAEIAPLNETPRMALTEHRLLVDMSSEGSMKALEEALERCAKGTELNFKEEPDASQEEKEAFYREAVAANLPEDMALEGDRVVWTESFGLYDVACAAEIKPLGEEPRAELTSRELLDDVEEEWN